MMLMRTGRPEPQPVHLVSAAERSPSSGATDVLMTDMVTGLSESFAALFRREYRHVARTVFLILHDQGAAEEITQDAFAKLLQRWERVSAYERPDAWVRQVAIRMALRRARREVRRPRIEGVQLVAMPRELPDIDVARAIAALSAHQRATVVLFYWDDRPVSEIAMILGSSESTVKQHLHRARHHLRALLDTGHEQ